MNYLIILSFFLAPAYVIKFKLYSYPANLLMLWLVFIWLVFFIWLMVKHRWEDFWQFLKNLEKKILVFTGLFFLAGCFGLVINGLDRAKLGQFIVLFLQPISIFFLAGYAFKKTPKTKDYLLLTTYYLLAFAGFCAIVQYYTLWTLPPQFWGNSIEPRRALAFFVHPNFYALWAAPLLALLIPDLAENLKSKILNPSRLGRPAEADLKSLAWVVGAMGLFLSLSRAGWLGLGMAVIVYLLVAADKKIRAVVFVAAAMALIIIFYIPNWRQRALLPFYGEKSASSRLELWQSGWKAVKLSPILGLGLNGYSYRYADLQTDPSLDTHNFPHNIFLDFWVETGLLGLISFVCITGGYIFYVLKNRSNPLALGIGLFLIALVAQGLIDNPYFKNDLALVFWIVLSTAI